MAYFASTGLRLSNAHALLHSVHEVFLGSLAASFAACAYILRIFLVCLLTFLPYFVDSVLQSDERLVWNFLEPLPGDDFELTGEVFHIPL